MLNMLRDGISSSLLFQDVQDSQMPLDEVIAGDG